MVGQFEICCILSEECACETGSVDSEPPFSNYRPKKVWDLNTALGSSIHIFPECLSFPPPPGLKSRIESIRLMLRDT